MTPEQTRIEQLEAALLRIVTLAQRRAEVSDAPQLFQEFEEIAQTALDGTRPPEKRGSNNS